MSRTNWKAWRPASLNEAIEGCAKFALEKHNRSIDRIADLMGAPSKWTLYKWMHAATLPANRIRAFEHACGATFVTQYIAVSARKLLIDFPTGRCAGTSDINAVNRACTDAVTALLDFADGKRTADETHNALTHAIEQLAFERANVERHNQPELALT
jgi:hypothetical protein